MAAEADDVEVDGGGEVKQTEQNQNKTDIIDMKSDAFGSSEISKENDIMNKNENNDETNNIEKENDNKHTDENQTTINKNEDNLLDEKSEQLYDDDNYDDDDGNKNDTLTDISKETLDLSLSIDQNDEVVLPTDRENENENTNEERFRVDRKQLENLLKGIKYFLF